MNRITISFGMETFMVPVDKILPSHKIPNGILDSRTYSKIKSSINEVGLIEPLSVANPPAQSDQYVLLDGHIRLLVLVEFGYTEVPCLIASDDESYTYNNRLNRVTSIQEHHMIRCAIDRGVTPERLARALDVDPRTILRKATLLDGICPEAIDLLKEHQFAPDLARVLRKMKPMRQVECVELMVSANAITVAYAEAMLVATAPAMLLEEKKTAKLAGLTQEQMARMEREMSSLQGQYKAVEQTYGEDVLNLVLAKSYLTKILANKNILRFLKQRQPEVLAEFEMIVKTVSLEG